ncbi:MAG: glycohydrolase toxin TNT-related protein [Verrucomicrobiota bacterium]
MNTEHQGTGQEPNNGELSNRAECGVRSAECGMVRLLTSTATKMGGLLLLAVVWLSFATQLRAATTVAYDIETLQREFQARHYYTYGTYLSWPSRTGVYSNAPAFPATGYYTDRSPEAMTLLVQNLVGNYFNSWAHNWFVATTNGTNNLEGMTNQYWTYLTIGYQTEDTNMPGYIAYIDPSVVTVSNYPTYFNIISNDIMQLKFVLSYPTFIGIDDNHPDVEYISARNYSGDILDDCNVLKNSTSNAFYYALAHNLWDTDYPNGYTPWSPGVAYRIYSGIETDYGTQQCYYVSSMSATRGRIAINLNGYTNTAFLYTYMYNYDYNYPGSIHYSTYPYNGVPTSPVSVDSKWHCFTNFNAQSNFVSRIYGDVSSPLTYEDTCPDLGNIEMLIREWNLGTVYVVAQPFFDTTPTPEPVVSSTNTDLPPCDNCHGMMNWAVSEPQINLWLNDTPFGYNPSKGPRVELTIHYQQGDGTTGSNPGVFSLGTGWASSWLSFMQGTGPTNQVYLPSGANVLMCTGRWNYELNARLDMVSDAQSNSWYEVQFGDGSKLVYGFAANGLTYLTKHQDPQGRAVTFQYTNSSAVLLRYVIDGDGLTNVVTYVANTNLIDHITDPYGRTASFTYDNQGRLTNITDVVQISSGIGYSSSGAVASLATPYGVTRFDYTGGADPNHANETVKAILVTRPDQSQHLYLRRDGGPDPVPASYSSNLVPVVTDFLTTFETANLNTRNTFHWNARQYPELSTTNVFNLSSNDYLKAKLSHWLQHPNANVVSQTLAMERAASPDGQTLGQITWYDHEGKPTSSIQGTQILPLMTAYVLPDGRTWYKRTERNAYGLVVAETEPWSDASGSVSLRTSTYEYAANGIDLVKHIRADGVTDLIAYYNADHQPRFSINANLEVTTYQYNTNTHQLTQRQIPSGLTTQYQYDTNTGYPTAVVDLEINRTNLFTFEHGLPKTHTDPRGLTVSLAYDNLERLVSVTYPDNTYTTNVYHWLDVVGAKDRLDHWTRYLYNPVRQRIAETNALNQVTGYSYCNCGSLESIINAIGDSIHYSNDFAGRLTQVVLPDNTSTTNQFDSLGRVQITRDGSGSVTNYYNLQGLLVAASNSFGRLFLIEYDILDRPLNVVSANGIGVSMTYDVLHRLRTRTLAGSVQESFEYSTAGLAIYYDPLSQPSYYYRDPAGRLLVAMDANSHETSYVYSPAGDLTVLTNANNQKTYWRYDIYGQVLAKTNNSGAVVFTNAFDANGQLTARWTPAKGLTTYTRDAGGNLLTVSHPSSTSISYSYDALNRLQSMSDVAGTSQFVYDPMGRLTSEDGPWDNDTVTLSYANRQRQTLSLQQPNAPAWTQTYTWDAMHRLQALTSPVGTFAYDFGGANVAASLVRKLSNPNGAYITNAFDYLARLTNTALIGTAGVLNAHGYEYNDASQRKSTVRADGRRVDFTYDYLGQLKTAIGKEADDTVRLHEQFGYAYDLAGNLNYRTNNALVQTFNVDGLNQLTSGSRSGTLTVAGVVSGSPTNITVNNQPAVIYADGSFARTNLTLSTGTNTFTAIAQDTNGIRATNIIRLNVPASASFAYDLNGNLTNDGQRGFDYDDENQLIRITATNQWKSEFVYDGLMRRRIGKEFTWTNSSWLLTNEVRYVYDGSLVVQERDSNNVPCVTYSRGLDLSGLLQGSGGIGGLLARTDNALMRRVGSSALQASAFYHVDGNGNVTMLVDAIQNIVARYQYDPYGNPLGISGSLADANHYRFSSKEWHPNSGLYYYLYRYYSANLQRWMNADPLGELGGRNLHRFNGNNPVDNVDPFGLTNEPGDFGWGMYSFDLPSQYYPKFDTGNYLSQANPRCATAMRSAASSPQAAMSAAEPGSYPLLTMPEKRNPALTEALNIGRTHWNDTDMGYTLALGDSFNLLSAPGFAIIGEGFASIFSSAAKETANLLPVRSPWPGNSGFIDGTVERKVLMPGVIVDRYGFGGGKFVSPAGTSVEARALRAGTENLPFNTYQVTKPIEVNAGGVSPCFGQPGLGVQYELPVSVNVLLKRGFLKPINP